MTRPNNVSTNYSYDSVSRLLSVLHQVGASTIDGASYGVDNAGTRTSKTDWLANVTSNYTYDQIYQLTQTTQGGNSVESYTYDAVGNRLSSLNASPYVYNSSNELTSDPSASFTYDSNGNPLTKMTSAGTTSYTWDFDNRLVSVTLPNNGGSVSFKYDPQGRRIQKSSASGTTNYVYDGVNLLEEVDSSGNVLARYTQGLGTDEPAAMVRAGTTNFYEADGLGSVTSLSNSSGAITATYTYDSFGNLTGSSGSITNPLRYTAREFDTETGLSYYRARYYEPTTGRLLNEDPIRFTGGINFYAYVHNSPLDLNDPSGLCPPQHPCAPSGEAPDPGWYAELGQSAGWVDNDLNLSEFRRGGSLDAQVLFGGSRDYANYVFGVYMAAAGYSLPETLSFANAYAASPSITAKFPFIHKKYPDLKPSDFDTKYTKTPAVNIADIIAGFSDLQKGTLCIPTK